MGFQGGSVIKNLPENAGDTGDMGLIPGSRRSLGVGNGNLLQYSCLGNPTDRGAWRAAVPVVTKCWTWLSMHTHACILFHWSVCLFLCQYYTILINVALCWNPGAWYLQLCSSFSRLLWLFKVFHVSIQILYLFVLVLWEIDCFWQYCHFDSIVIVC